MVVVVLTTCIVVGLLVTCIEVALKKEPKRDGYKVMWIEESAPMSKQAWERLKDRRTLRNRSERAQDW